MDIYRWLLFGHLFGVVAMVTGWAIYVASVDSLRRAQSVAQVRTLVGQATVGERILAGGGLLLIGFGVTLVVKFYDFSQPWIVGALGLVVVQGLLGAALVGPRTHRVQAALKDVPDGPLTAELAALARDRLLHLANRASIPVLVDIEFLMTLKPDTPEILLSLAGVVIVAFVLCWPIRGDRPRPAPPLPTAPRA